MQTESCSLSKNFAISGRCGRLMCCLRYEDETYEDLKKRLPHRKSRVGTPEGPGIVLDTKILVQLALVQLEEDGRQIAVPIEDLGDPDAPRPAAEKAVEDPLRGLDAKTAEAKASPRGRKRRGDRSKQEQQDAYREQAGDSPPERPGDAAPETGDPPKKKRRRRRRRKSGGDSTKTGTEPTENRSSPDEASPKGESDDSAPRKKRRRRRRRRRGGGDSDGGGDNGGSD